MSSKTKSYELDTPSFFDPKKVEEIWSVPYEERMLQAAEWARRHNLKPAAQDRVKIALMPIDAQITFCHPSGALYVAGRSGNGALEDTARTAEFIYRNLRVITGIVPTLDTHTAFQIFHRAFWVDQQGNHPAPATLISLDDVKAGVWSVNPAMAYAVLGDAAKYAYLMQYALHYVESLTGGGKYPLMIWPHHAMLGDIHHALMPSLQEAIYFHTIARGSQPAYRVKGGNPLTENYSVIEPEVLEDQQRRAIAARSAKFLETLLKYDRLIICGQAKSHCVAWTIADLLSGIQAQDPELARKVYLVEDLTSPVVIPGVIDFTDMANEAFKRFAAAGMHVVRSTEAVEDWPEMPKLS